MHSASFARPSSSAVAPRFAARPAPHHAQTAFRSRAPEARAALFAADTFTPGPTTAARAAPARAAVDVWSSDDRALQAVSPERPWASLNAAQRGLFGSEGERGYRALSGEQRELVLFLSERLIANGIDLEGMQLKDAAGTTRPNRVLFSPDSPGMARFEAQLQAGAQAGKFAPDDVFGLFHRGMAETGFREERRNFTMQIGIGDAGAFVDVDRFHPWKGVSAWVGHFLEIVTPGKPDVDDMARAIAG